MIDLLLPSTDGGALAQLIVWALLTTTALLATWRNKDLRLLVIGLATLTLGIMAVRAIH